MNEVITALTTRASCRKFTGQHVEKEKIEQIIAAGLGAPTGANRQTPIFIVVQDDEKVKMLSKLNAKFIDRDVDPFYGAPDVILVAAKKEATYIYDGALALGNMLNAAFSLGLGATWIHRAKEMLQTQEGEELLKELGITDEVEGIGCCILGYPAAELKAVPKKDGRVFYL